MILDASMRFLFRCSHKLNFGVWILAKKNESQGLASLTLATLINLTYYYIAKDIGTFDSSKPV